MWETVVSNQSLIFTCFNVILMIGTHRCNYLVYGPQVCSWVLDCHIRPYLDVRQVASCGILALHGDLCCVFFLDLLLNFYASLSLRSELPAVSWVDILDYVLLSLLT